MQCPGRDRGSEKSAKPDRMDGGTESNPHVRWCGRGEGRNPVTSTRPHASTTPENESPCMQVAYDALDADARYGSNVT